MKFDSDQKNKTGAIYQGPINKTSLKIPFSEIRPFYKGVLCIKGYYKRVFFSEKCACMEP